MMVGKVRRRGKVLWDAIPYKYFKKQLYYIPKKYSLEIYSVYTLNIFIRYRVNTKNVSEHILYIIIV